MRPAFDDVLRVPVAAGHVVVHHRAAPGRPAALLTHGTGFCAATWTGVIEQLAGRFDLFAVDRRGHGTSSAPADAYDFTDFADDAVRVIDALGLQDAFAIGHSAGATDLLLAAASRPAAFRRMFVMEPTAMDPAEPGVRAHLAPAHAETLDAFARRRATFPSRAAVAERYEGRGVFAGWQPGVLAAFVEAGFAEVADGSVTLRCTPVNEVAMLRSIFAAMEGTYRTGEGANPFSSLGLVHCPVTVATTEHSQDIYKDMAAVAARLLPDVTQVHFDGLGHVAPMVDPVRVADEVIRCWQG